MSNLDEILNKLPYFDGGFRRRMTAGAIVTITIVIMINSGNSLEHSFKSLSDLISSPAAALLFFLLVHAVGRLVEVLAELFVARLTGNTAWAVKVPEWTFMDRSKVLKFILRVLFLPVTVILIYYGWCRAMSGQSIYRWEKLEDELNTETQTQFNSYPEAVKDGLREPFGTYGKSPWTYFADLGGTVSARALARTLENRDKDLLTIVTSLLIATVFLLVWYRDASIFDLSTSTINILVLTLVMPLFIYLLLYSYFILVRQSILNILECNSFRPMNVSTAETSDE